MIDADPTESRLVRLETSLGHLEREVARVEEQDRQERLSILQSLAATSEMVVRVDEMLRGRNGDNGLSLKVSLLSERLATSDAAIGDQIDRLRSYIGRAILALIATIITAVVVRQLLGA